MKRWGILVAAVLVLAGCSGGSSSSLGSYGRTASSVAKQLKTCTTTTRISKDVAKCVGASGDHVAIQTTGSATEQDFAVASLKDNQAGECAAVIKGAIFLAADEPTLTGFLGIPESFVSKHHGYMLCPITG